MRNVKRGVNLTITNYFNTMIGLAYRRGLFV